MLRCGKKKEIFSIRDLNPKHNFLLFKKYASDRGELSKKIEPEPVQNHSEESNMSEDNFVRRSNRFVNWSYMKKIEAFIKPSFNQRARKAIYTIEQTRSSHMNKKKSDLANSSSDNESKKSNTNSRRPARSTRNKNVVKDDSDSEDENENEDEDEYDEDDAESDEVEEVHETSRLRQRKAKEEPKVHSTRSTRAAARSDRKCYTVSSSSSDEED